MKFLNNLFVIATGAAFIFYGFYYYFSPVFKLEFKRFGLEKFGILAATLQILGGIGLLLGLYFPIILTISSLGLAILMFLGVMTRIKVKDSLLQTLPALFFMIMNTYIFLHSISVIG